MISYSRAYTFAVSSAYLSCECDWATVCAMHSNLWRQAIRQRCVQSTLQPGRREKKKLKIMNLSMRILQHSSFVEGRKSRTLLATEMKACTVAGRVEECPLHTWPWIWVAKGRELEWRILYSYDENIKAYCRGMDKLNVLRAERDARNHPWCNLPVLPCTNQGSHRPTRYSIY